LPQKGWLGESVLAVSQLKDGSIKGLITHSPKKGAGPKPIPFPSLNFQTLTAAIQFCLTPEATEAARGLHLDGQLTCGFCCLWSEAKLDSSCQCLKVERWKELSIL
jgi:hypothetical protein